MRSTVMIILSITWSTLPALSREHSPPEVLAANKVFAAEDMLLACEAIIGEDVEKLGVLVKSGLDLNERGKGGCTLLLWCWCNGYHHAFEALLEMGADPHATVDTDLALDIEGNRIILHAGESVAWVTVRHSVLRKQFVDKVIRYLRNANQRDATGGTLFHALFASADDTPVLRPAITQELVQADSSYKILAEKDRLKAVDSEIFAIIYFAGVDINAKDDAGLSAVERYIKWMQNSEASRLNFEIAASTAIGLVAATEYFNDAKNRTNIIAELEILGEKSGFTEIVANQIKRVMSFSREKPRPIQRYDRFGKSGVFIVKDMHTDILAAEVLEAIMPVGLHRFKPQRSFEALREVGFDPDARGKCGFTHLFAAYLFYKQREFNALLEMGANPDLRLEQDLWGCVPAIIQGVSSAVYCPEQGDTVLLAAALDPTRLEYLVSGLKFTKSTDTVDGLNRNLLHRFLFPRVDDNRVKILTDVMLQRVDVNSQSIGGMTPCHVAVFRNALVIPELVRRGARTDIRDLQGRTVIDLLRLSVNEKWTFHEESSQVLATLSDAAMIQEK